MTDRQCEPPLLWRLIQVVTVAGPGPACLTQHGGWAACTHACMFAHFPGTQSSPRCTCGHRCFLLLPPASHHVLRFHFISLTFPHPHCFCLSLPPQLDLPPQAVPHKQSEGAKIRFNVADKVLPAMAPLVSHCVPPQTLLFILVQILSLSLYFI